MSEEKSDNSNEINNDSDEGSDSEKEFTLFDPNFKINKTDLVYEVNIKGINLFRDSEENKEQNQWSDTLNDIVWQFSRCPCAWRFDKHTKYVANEKVVFATCRDDECKANLFVATESDQTKMKIIVKNFNKEASHKEKRSVKNSNREKIAEMLILNKASYVHAELSNEILKPSDSVPAHLPNVGTLRKINQREKEKKYIDPDPVYAICKLKNDAAYHKCIADIGLDPFYCFFSTPEQVEWLRLSTRYGRCVISIDSTGSAFNFIFFIVHKCKPNSISIHYNLYKILL